MKAFVSLQPGRTAEETELISFCRARRAAYKYPRQIELMPELPKTATGKILRRALRSAATVSDEVVGEHDSRGAALPYAYASRLLSTT